MEDCSNCSPCGENTCVESQTLVEAKNYPWWPGCAKVDVVLSEFSVQIDTEATITLARAAMEIKRIKKNVFLTQCRLIAGTDKLFIMGYVRKNIEYATADSVQSGCISGGIFHTTVDVPFHCITRVCFKRDPQLYSNSQVYETEYLNKKGCGADLTQQDRSFCEEFNEKVFYELEWADVYEADIAEDPVPINGSCNEQSFRNITEKLVVYLTIKLLQKQQIGAPWLTDAAKDSATDKEKETFQELPDRTQYLMKKKY